MSAIVQIPVSTIRAWAVRLIHGDTENFAFDITNELKANINLSYAEGKADALAKIGIGLNLQFPRDLNVLNFIIATETSKLHHEGVDDNKILLIKNVRMRTSLGLKECKDAVDRVQNEVLSRESEGLLFEGIPHAEDNRAFWHGSKPFTPAPLPSSYPTPVPLPPQKDFLEF
jgi:ribosomal protein L7/L12